MPGLSQLRKFSEDIKDVGDEIKIRAQRGEKPVTVPLPEGISEEDDSSDFLLGMPEGKIPVSSQNEESKDEGVFNADSAPKENEDDRLNDIKESGDETSGDETDEDGAARDSADDVSFDLPDDTEENPSEEASEFDSHFIDPLMPAGTDFSDDEPDLSDFLNDEPLSSQDDNAAARDIVNSSSDSSAETENAAFDTSTLDSDFNSSPEEKSDDGFSGQNDFDSDFGEEAISLNNDIPEEILKKDGVGSSANDEVPVSSELGSAIDDSLFGQDIDDLEFTSMSSPSENEGVNDSLFSSDSNDSTAVNENAEAGETIQASETVPDIDTGSFENDSPSSDVFDTSEMENVDFSPAPSGISADDFPVTGEAGQDGEDDFVLDGSFTIPGFSDTETADFSKSRKVDNVNFKGKTVRPKNTLTEEEYERFNKNLADYPLNLRLTVEDFISKDEFTDDVVFEVIEKILNKTSARQLAGHLEKLLDISISIPRDYEKRSFEQYEAYKQSFQYTLRNRIIPAAALGLILCFVCFGLFKASQKFIYEPVMASINYKQGYELLMNNDFPQSDAKFKEAVSHKPVKKWFFRYANGYREKKQYERAANIYKNTLLFFDHDLQAGIEYAEMELYERANYERAEQIVKREILDYHINSPEGMLLLGDVLLEWGEVDYSKYELARNQYLELIQRYGETNLYLSRLLRYNIRTDNLLNVLNLKNVFYPTAKNLSGEDWTELSGYLFDKFYGTLTKNEEYLRAQIEDVKGLLELALTTDGQNPVAHYNLARYLVNTAYTEQAKNELEVTLKLFASAQRRSRKNIYREINASRILGEIYAGNREYLEAQEKYTHGVTLYNTEHDSSGFEGDENTGKLFADLGDIDYFISGDIDSALLNYETAVQIKNDTPSVNYKIGAIYYGKNDYASALSAFIKVHEVESGDLNVLMALGNTLALRGDNFAARSYYENILSKLDAEKTKRVVLLPQDDEEEAVIVDQYLRANNNLGVALYKIALQTGNSQANAKAMVCFSDSNKAWDALTRNMRTMVRMEGSNLAAQNSKYVTHSYPDFEPAIYTEIEKVLVDDDVLK